jgi:hypothetical protein
MQILYNAGSGFEEKRLNYILITVQAVVLMRKIIVCHGADIFEHFCIVDNQQ